MTTRNAVHGQRGFTVVEMLVAMGIMMAVTAATFSLMNPAQGTFAAQPEVMDMQQRLRIGVDGMYKDLLMAGAGAYSGSMTGSLANYFAPILPYRTGNVTPDPAGSFFTDRLTLMYVPTTPAQTSISSPMPANSAEIKVTAEPGCPNSDLLCGFKTGMKVLIFDTSGNYDAFDITNVQSSALHLQHQGTTFETSYAQGSYIDQVYSYTYWWNHQTNQLMRYDGDQGDLPIADNVVGLNFDYYGDPNPAQLRPGLTPGTTFGPTPPGLGVANSGTPSYPAGENCAFKVVAGAQVPRMSTLGNPAGGLVKLTQAQLTDGPWCPDPTSANKYDVDLYRIKKIRVTLRVQTGQANFRGPAGTLFKVAGTSAGGERYVPDQQIQFDVTPRNLNFGR